MHSLLHQSKLKKSKERKKKKNIHINILTQNSDFFAIHAQKDINTSMSALKLPNDLEEAHIIPA